MQLGPREQERGARWSWKGPSNDILGKVKATEQVEAWHDSHFKTIILAAVR